MSKSKEDIMEGYESHRVMTDADYYEDLWPLGCIEQAMDEYSKAQSIAFAEWKYDKSVEVTPDSVGSDPMWYFIYDISHAEKTYTTEQLYDLFLTHQSQDK